ncbi:MAG: hypothetical protein P9M13_11135 [Candidatus Ancaeobacter aquaticus]|nr:hypothetical protein [Candidatus Ancaeobacter aquaticus]
MIRRFVASSVLLLFVSISFSGCTKASFPEDYTINAIIDMCKKEYNVKVKAKVVGETLGVYIPLGSLLANDMSFKEDALTILQDVSLSVRRVCLSTDANYNYFTVIGADRAMNIEFVMSHNTYDLRQIMLGNISRGDYVKRMTYQIRYDMQAFGDQRIKNFFIDMSSARIEKIISNNFYPGITLKDISSTFFLSLLELSMKDKIQFKVTYLNSMPINKDEILYYCTVTETYEPKPEYAADMFTHPSGFVHHYLFVVTGKDAVVGIKKIFPLNAVSVSGTESVAFPEEYAQYDNVAEWDKNNFYIRDISKPYFLANQIAQRIRNRVTEEGVVSLESIDGSYVNLDPQSEKEEDLELVLKVKDKGEITKDMTRKVLRTFIDVSITVYKQVCKDYKFHDFKKITIFDANNKVLFTIDKVMLKTK